MAKSYVSALVGAAIREGKIKSVDQSVSDFLPWFKDGEKKNILIKHLLTMSSGLEWDEAYANPFSVTTEAYYGDNLPSLFEKQKVESQPGKEFSYKSGDTQLLGFIVEKATGKSLAEYAEEKLWQPMGAEHDAYWSLDKQNGHEKAYCCINSNARDFARLGYLYMHKGNWKGKQLIDSSYVDSSTTCANLSFQGGKCDFYGYQWWVVPEYKGTKVFYARGILGQAIVVVPEWNMIAVRLGKNRGEKVKNHFGLVFDMVDEMRLMMNK
jgi:CubicO group peptidase (beta-lactamase class C family)